MIVDRELVAAALPGYELGSQVGRGAFGIVVVAKDRLRRDVAVKIMPGVSYRGEHAETEALNLARLIHPHIVHVHDFMPAGDIALIVMELLAGGSLRGRIRRGRAAPEWACAVALAVASALEAAHDRGLLHRDVKPENVLFTADGRLKMTDFGIAKALTDTGIMTSTVIGTPRYMAPEQFMAGTLRRSVDVYALAVMTYEMLAGRPPSGESADTYETLRRFHLYTPPPPMDGVPGPIADVVLRALAKDPDMRQTTARVFALELAAAAAAVFGAGWLTAAGIDVELDIDVRNACEPVAVENALTISDVAPGPEQEEASPTVARGPRDAPGRLNVASAGEDLPAVGTAGEDLREDDVLEDDVPKDEDDLPKDRVPAGGVVQDGVPDGGVLGDGVAEDDVRPARAGALPGPSASSRTVSSGPSAMAPPAPAPVSPAPVSSAPNPQAPAVRPPQRRPPIAPADRATAWSRPLAPPRGPTTGAGTPGTTGTTGTTGTGGADYQHVEHGAGLVEVSLGTDPEYRRHSRRGALLTIAGTLLIVALLGVVAVLLL